MGKLCAAGLTTMGEILDPSGPWDVGLIETMLPVAVEIETRREQAWNRAATAAIATVFSKGDVGKKYSDSLEKVLELVRIDQSAARGEGLDHHAIAAQKLVDTITKAEGMRRV